MIKSKTKQGIQTTQKPKTSAQYCFLLQQDLTILGVWKDRKCTDGNIIYSKVNCG